MPTVCWVASVLDALTHAGFWHHACRVLGGIRLHGCLRTGDGLVTPDVVGVIRSYCRWVEKSPWERGHLGRSGRGRPHSQGDQTSQPILIQWIYRNLDPQLSRADLKELHPIVMVRFDRAISVGSSFVSCNLS